VRVRRSGQTGARSGQVWPLPNPLPRTGEGTGPVIVDAPVIVDLHGNDHVHGAGDDSCDAYPFLVPLLHVRVEERVRVRRSGPDP